MTCVSREKNATASLRARQHPLPATVFERNQNFGRLEATTTMRFCARRDNCHFVGEAHPDPPWDGPRGPMPPRYRRDDRSVLIDPGQSTYPPPRYNTQASVQGSLRCGLNLFATTCGHHLRGLTRPDRIVSTQLAQ